MKEIFGIIIKVVGVFLLSFLATFLIIKLIAKA